MWALALIMLLFPVNSALAFKATYNLPCMVSYDGRPPITTICVADITSTGGMTLETLKTPNGKRFIIENAPSDAREWYIDHKPAVKVSEEPYTCYQSREVKLCL